ncbi:PqqD family peptide modification chaperone [Fodinicurvata halophila]|uniref:PqqD family peptide modification chaperone n=1 Tax=Fodinicurvata halophila TaxID=1419723 RepID=A0ABV8UFU0_9PROT
MSSQVVRFSGMQRPVVFADCPEIPLALQEIAPSWHFDIQEDSGISRSPAILMRKSEGAYGIGVPWRESPWWADTLVGAICSFAVDLIESHLMDNPGLLGLHGAAARFHDGMVLFPAERRIGKSTLVTRLLLDGIRVYGDDLIALDAQGRGMAYGFPPRLRLPFPETAGPALREFVGGAGGARDEDYLYLSPQLPNLAPHGETAPLSAIVLLSRERDVETRLRTLPESEGLHHLAAQYLARETSTDEVLGRCHKLAETLPTYCLHYSCLEEASACLREHFSRQQGAATLRAASGGGSWPEMSTLSAPSVLEEDPPPFLQETVDSELPELAEASAYVQVDGVKAQRLDGDLFLSHRQQGSIHRLNPIGASLWGLLAVPIRLEEALETFRTAFPDVEPEQLERDLQRIFRELLSEDLIRPVN